MQLGGPGDRHDPGLLSKQPRKRNLCGRCSFCATNLFQEFDQRPVRLARIRCKSWQGAAIVAADKGGGLVDAPSQKTAAKRAVGYEANPEFLTGRQHLLFGASPP